MGKTLQWVIILVSDFSLEESERAQFVSNLLQDKIGETDYSYIPDSYIKENTLESFQGLLESSALATVSTIEGIAFEEEYQVIDYVKEEFHTVLRNGDYDSSVEYFEDPSHGYWGVSVFLYKPHIDGASITRSMGQQIRNAERKTTEKKKSLSPMRRKTMSIPIMGKKKDEKRQLLAKTLRKPAAALPDMTIDNSEERESTFSPLKAESPPTRQVYRPELPEKHSESSAVVPSQSLSEDSNEGNDWSSFIEELDNEIGDSEKPSPTVSADIKPDITSKQETGADRSWTASKKGSAIPSMYLTPPSEKQTSPNVDNPEFNEWNNFLETLDDAIGGVEDTQKDSFRAASEFKTERTEKNQQAPEDKPAKTFTGRNLFLTNEELALEKALKKIRETQRMPMMPPTSQQEKELHKTPTNMQMPGSRPQIATPPPPPPQTPPKPETYRPVSDFAEPSVQNVADIPADILVEAPVVSPPVPVQNKMKPEKRSFFARLLRVALIFSAIFAVGYGYMWYMHPQQLAVYQDQVFVWGNQTRQQIYQLFGLDSQEEALRQEYLAVLQKIGKLQEEQGIAQLEQFITANENRPEAAKWIAEAKTKRASLIEQQIDRLLTAKSFRIALDVLEKYRSGGVSQQELVKLESKVKDQATKLVEDAIRLARQKSIEGNFREGLAALEIPKDQLSQETIASLIDAKSKMLGFFASRQSNNTKKCRQGIQQLIQFFNDKDIDHQSLRTEHYVAAMIYKYTRFYSRRYQYKNARTIAKLKAYNNIPSPSVQEHLDKIYRDLTNESKLLRGLQVGITKKSRESRTVIQYFDGKNRIGTTGKIEYTTGGLREGKFVIRKGNATEEVFLHQLELETLKMIAKAGFGNFSKKVYYYLGLFLFTHDRMGDAEKIFSELKRAELFAKKKELLLEE